MSLLTSCGRVTPTYLNVEAGAGPTIPKGRKRETKMRTDRRVVRPNDTFGRLTDGDVSLLYETGRDKGRTLRLEDSSPLHFGTGGNSLPTGEKVIVIKLQVRRCKGRDQRSRRPKITRTNV